MDASSESSARRFAKRAALTLLWCGWQAFRLPLLGAMLMFAPFVRIALSGFAFVGTLTALLFEFAGTRPFPFFRMLAIYLGALAILWLYETLIQLLSR